MAAEATGVASSCAAMGAMHISNNDSREFEREACQHAYT